MVCEPAATNLCTNPSAEVDLLNGYSVNGVTHTRDNIVPAYSGSYSSKAVFAGADPFEYLQYEVAHVVSDVHTFSFSYWARGVGTLYPMAIVFKSVGSTGTSVGSGTVLSAVEWRRVTLSVSTIGGDTTSILAVRMMNQPNDGSTGPVVTWYMDAIQIEEGSATEYLDGSLGMGYAWTGTAHASASTRSLLTEACEGTYDNFQLR
jgi:hypothetical protein